MLVRVIAMIDVHSPITLAYGWITQHWCVCERWQVRRITPDCSPTDCGLPYTIGLALGLGPVLVTSCALSWCPRPEFPRLRARLYLHQDPSGCVSIARVADHELQSGGVSICYYIVLCAMCHSLYDSLETYTSGLVSLTPPLLVRTLRRGFHTCCSFGHIPLGSAPLPRAAAHTS